MIGNQKITAVVQARMGSTRLWGKVMMPLAREPVLWHVLRRLEGVKFLDEIVVATSDRRRDDRIEEFLAGRPIRGGRLLRGSEEDVLSRFARAVEVTRAHLIVRVTADSPLLSPAHLERMVNLAVETGCDGVDGHRAKTGLTLGFGTEVYRSEVLMEASKEAKRKEEREHVSLFIKEKPGRYEVAYLKPDRELISDHRLTLDTEDDYARLDRLYETFYRDEAIVDCKEVIRFLDRRGCTCCQEQSPLVTPRRQ